MLEWLGGGICSVLLLKIIFGISVEHWLSGVLLMTIFASALYAFRMAFEAL